MCLVYRGRTTVYAWTTNGKRMRAQKPVAWWREPSLRMILCSHDVSKVKLLNAMAKNALIGLTCIKCPRCILDDALCHVFITFPHICH